MYIKFEGNSMSRFAFQCEIDRIEEVRCSNIRLNGYLYMYAASDKTIEVAFDEQHCTMFLDQAGFKIDLFTMSKNHPDTQFIQFVKELLSKHILSQLTKKMLDDAVHEWYANRMQEFEKLHQRIDEEMQEADKMLVKINERTKKVKWDGTESVETVSD